MSSLAPLVVIAFALAAVPWVLVAGRRFGHLLAGASVLAIELLAVLLTLVASAWLRFDAVASALIALALILVAGLVAGWRRGFARPGRSAVATWAPAALGGLVWAGVVAASARIPGGSPLAWVMNGDGFNNLYYARVILHDGGVAVGGLANPAPLPAAAIVLAGMPSGAAGSGGAVLEAELTSLAIAWVLALGLWCLVSGVAVASLVPRDRPAVTAVAAALGSLLPLTAFAGGLPMEWGYFNVNFAIPLVLLGWLVQFASHRHPVAALVASAAILTLLLATWAPLAVLLAPAPAVVLGREWPRLRTLRGVRLVVLLLAVGQLGAWGLLMTAPSLLQQSAALITFGHGFPATWGASLALIAALGILALVFARRLERPAIQATLALASGSVLAVAAVIALAGGVTGYYPTKLSWLLVVVLGSVALALVVGRLARLRRAALPAIAVACAAALAVATFVVPSRDGDWARRQPALMVLAGRVWHAGPATVERILTMSDSADPALLWSSGDPDEGIIDFWVLVTNGGEFGSDPLLRSVAFEAYRAQRDTGSWEGSEVTQLCELVARIPGLTVYSEDPTLGASLGEVCGIPDSASPVRTLDSLEARDVTGDP